MTVKPAGIGVNGTQRRIRMDLNPTSPAISGSGQRKCISWIDRFVEETDNLECAPIWRKWAAISTIAAVLERKVFVVTSSPLYPNLYTFLVGFAGLGKTKAIMAAMEYAREIADLHFGPTSMTMASLTDSMLEAKRTIIQLPDPPLEYCTVYFVADELSAAMAQYDPELVAGLTTFFDGVPYSQARRTKELRIKIPKPQLNMLIGTTPSNLIKTLPETAWEQGFTSRTLLIYSEERPIIDTFNTEPKPLNKDMIYDLKAINTTVGQFGWTEEYATAMHNWKILGYTPAPNHPKLAHYCSRRFSHLIKLSMIANVDRGSDLCLAKEDFNRAMGWLLEAEVNMTAIFQTGSSNTDSAAMDEIQHFVAAFGDKGVSEHKVVHFAKDYVPGHSVLRVIEIMEKSGMIYAGGQDRFGSRVIRIVPAGIHT